MAAYVSRKPDGSVSGGWILKSGTSISSAMCHPSLRGRNRERIEEVPTHVVLEAAGDRKAESRERRGKAKPAKFR